MKIKRITTIILSLVATLGVTLGTVALASGGSSLPMGSQTQPSVASENKDKAYYVGREGSTASYGQDNNSDVMGVRASLMPDDVLTFNNVIDLNEMYKKGESFIEFYSIVPEVGRLDYKSIVVEMYDVYDNTNFLKIQLNANPFGEDSSEVGYFSACASNGQKLTGYEWNGKPTDPGTLYVNNVYGQWSIFTFGDHYAEKGGTGLFYDVEQKKIYAVPFDGRPKRQIIDFDDPMFFGTYLWEGFTSNEVYCTIRCLDYKSEKANILVGKYGNYNLAKVDITDNVAPVLPIDYGGYDEQNLPKGLINYPYKLFEAKAFDAVDGYIDYEVEVIYGYNTSNPQNVTVKNGSFKPTMPGTHQVRYFAKDSHDNEVEKILYVDVLATQPTITIDFEEVVYEIMEGELYEVPSYQISNALGTPSIKITASINGEEIEVDEEEGIRPFVSGEIKITYTVKDYVGRTIKVTHDVEVSEATIPTFIEEPILPKRLIVGNSYDFPSLNAYDYVTAQGDKIPTEIFVKENGQEKALTGGEYVVGDFQEVEIIYRATIGDAIGEWKKTVPVVDVKTDGYLDMSKYFIPSNASGSAVATDSAIDLTVTDGVSFEFVNYVTAYSFINEFSYGLNPQNLDKFHIILTDVKDSKKFIKFTYDLKGSVPTFYVNDNQDLKLEVSVPATKGLRNQLVFNSEEKSVHFDINKGSALSVTTFYNGEQYRGFTNERAYVTYVLEGVKGEVSVAINSLNLTYFSNDTGDYMAPLVGLLGKVGGERLINEVVDIPKIVSNDVLFGDVDAFVTLKTPSGQFATTEDGKLLNNLLCDGSLLKVKLTEYGKYELHVTATDKDGNQGLATMVIRVVDTEKPNVTLDGEIQSTAKVGKKIKLPKVKVTDNFSKNCEVRIYVFTKTGPMTEIFKNEDGFVATSAGEYTVLYYVYDEAGNCVTMRYVIKVA